MRGVTVPEARSHPVLRRYALRSLRLPLGDSMLAVVLPDANDWVRRGHWAAAAERGAEPPYWVQVWPAAVAMARLLCRFGDLRGRRVLDLGCGLGIPGISAARAGAAVTFADREQDALTFAQWNGARVAPAGVTPVIQRIDWSREVVQGEFDAILLSDVSYRVLHHGPLRRQIEVGLAPGGCIVHADPMRSESLAFLMKLREDLVTLETNKETHFDDKRVKVRLVVAARSRGDLRDWNRVVGQAAGRAEGNPS